jgi:aspartokinase-like uncharacterized kinase
MTVVKLGGSLFDHPRLGPGLSRWLQEWPEPSVVVVGGGGFADVVRSLDRVHHLGEETAHWLAIDTLRLSAAFVRTLLAPHASSVSVADLAAFAQQDRELPHAWSVTTDSLALQYAIAHRASRLVLLKSTDIPPGTPWAEAAAHGWVDEFFPRLVPRFVGTISTVNFRAWLDERG